jgi:hypothetical protein
MQFLYLFLCTSIYQWSEIAVRHSKSSIYMITDMCSFFWGFFLPHIADYEVSYSEQTFLFFSTITQWNDISL